MKIFSILIDLIEKNATKEIKTSKDVGASSSVVKDNDSSLYLSPSSKNMANQIERRRILPRKAKLASGQQSSTSIPSPISARVTALKRSSIPTPIKSPSNNVSSKIVHDIVDSVGTTGITRRITKTSSKGSKISSLEKVKKSIPEREKTVAKKTSQKVAKKTIEIQTTTALNSSSIPILKSTSSKPIVTTKSDDVGTIRITRTTRATAKLMAAATLPSMEPIKSVQKVPKEVKKASTAKSVKLQAKKPDRVAEKRRNDIEKDVEIQPSTSSSVNAKKIQFEVSPTKQVKLTLELPKVTKPKIAKKSPKVTKKVVKKTEKVTFKKTATDLKVPRPEITPKMEEYQLEFNPFSPAMNAEKIPRTPISLFNRDQEEKERENDNHENRRHSKVWHSPMSASMRIGLDFSIAECDDNPPVLDRPNSPPILSSYAKKIAENANTYQCTKKPLPIARYKFESNENLHATSSNQSEKISKFAKRRDPPIYNPNSSLNDSNAENNQPQDYIAPISDIEKVKARSPLKNLPLPELPQGEASGVSIYNVTLDKSVHEVEVVVSIKSKETNIMTSTPKHELSRMLFEDNLMKKASFYSFSTNIDIFQ